MVKPSSLTRAARKYAQRRRAAEGFPTPARPFTLAEVRDYFAGERITCLLCGRDKLRLAIHLPKIHGVSEDEYREMYGLPWRRGLTGSISNARYSAAAIERWPDRSHISNPVNRALAHEAARRQRSQPYHAEIATANLGEHVRHALNDRAPNGQFLPKKETSNV